MSCRSPNAAREPVDARDHQHITRAQEAQNIVKSVAPRSGCPTALLGPDHVATTRAQSLLLQFEVLVGGTHARIADNVLFHVLSRYETVRALPSGQPEPIELS
jgi:hypothetical protein